MHCVVPVPPSQALPINAANNSAKPRGYLTRWSRGPPVTAHTEYAAPYSEYFQSRRNPIGVTAVHCPGPFRFTPLQRPYFICQPRPVKAKLQRLHTSTSTSTSTPTTPRGPYSSQLTPRRPQRQVHGPEAVHARVVHAGARSDDALDDNYITRRRGRWQGTVTPLPRSACRDS